MHSSPQSSSPNQQLLASNSVNNTSNLLSSASSFSINSNSDHQVSEAISFEKSKLTDPRTIIEENWITKL